MLQLGRAALMPRWPFRWSTLRITSTAPEPAFLPSFNGVGLLRLRIVNAAWHSHHDEYRDHLRLIQS
jgi:hypothetical protein